MSERASSGNSGSGAEERSPAQHRPHASQGQGGDRPPPPLEPLQWHAVSADEALAAVGCDSERGLDDEEAARRLAHFGPNAIREPRRRGPLAIIGHQLRSPLVLLLLIAAAVAFVLGEAQDALVILVVVALNTAIGALQEGRAERSLEGLRRLAAQRARVVRSGREQRIAARGVVPGDLIVFEAGDAIAADARLVELAGLRLSEAALTGESVPVDKTSEPVAADTALADRRNLVYAGTSVAAGRGRAVVVATGAATEIGGIARLAEATGEPATPLERRIARFGRQVLIVAAILFGVVLVLGTLRGRPLAEILMVAISQVVGLVPEGLPVATTIALAVGVQRMARRHAIVRRLAAVETLGSTTVICSDKTGTLTRNEMTVRRIVLGDGRALDVTGTGYAPDGRIDGADGAALRALLEVALLCNDASLDGPHASAPAWRPIGDPTEVALVVLAMKGGLDPAIVRRAAPRRAERPFDPAHKRMATEHATPAGRFVALKGAPEAVLPLCGALRTEAGDAPLDDAGRARLDAAVDAMGEASLRVLALARVPDGRLEAGTELEAFRGRAVLLGLVGQLDPPREQAKTAVARCREAGIRPVMVTGDHKATGLAVARELGIARPGDRAVDGVELARMSDVELFGQIDSISVFARVHPAQKLRIVRTLQERGQVVAMTGDGVNDAPALARADVGVAMGGTGTDVARRAAKIVIADDDFSTIVAAVEEGRLVYRNVQKIVLFLLSTSVDEVLVLLLALALGYPPPLAAVQILWINLVTEGTVTVNLIVDPPEGDEMTRGPVSPREPLVSRALLTRIAFLSPATASSTLGWFVYRLGEGLPFAQVQTETFTVLAVCQWFSVLCCRSQTRSALGLDILRNPWLIGGLVLSNLMQLAVVFYRPLGEVFHTVPIELETALWIGLAASPVLWVEELRKLFARRRRRRRAARGGD